MPKLSNAAAMGWSSANSMLRNQAVIFIIPKSKRVPVHELLNILIVSFWREFSLFDNECMVRGSGFHRSSRAPPPSQSGLGTCLTVNFTITAMRNSRTVDAVMVPPEKCSFFFVFFFLLPLLLKNSFLKNT